MLKKEYKGSHATHFIWMILLWHQWWYITTGWWCYCNSSDKKLRYTSFKKLFKVKKYYIKKIWKGQHYLKLNRVKAKLYVSKTYRLRNLIMELYTLPAPYRITGSVPYATLGRIYYLYKFLTKQRAWNKIRNKLVKSYFPGPYLTII